MTAAAQEASKIAAQTEERKRSDYGHGMPGRAPILVNVFLVEPCGPVGDKLMSDLATSISRQRVGTSEGGESSAAAGGVSIFAEVEAAAGLDLLCLDDPLLLNIIADGAAATLAAPGRGTEAP